MHRLALCCLAAALILAGCGGDDAPRTNAGATTGATTPARTTAEKAWIENAFELPESPGPHPGAKVEQLIVKDVVEGDGDELEAGDTGYFEFILADWHTGKLIDRSWGKKEPFSIKVEHDVAIDGWWQGLPGMRVGGRRTLVIPPSLGFVNNPNPKVSGKTTYFDVVLLGVVKEEPAGVGAQGEGGAPAQ